MCLIELGYDLCDRVATLPVDATAEQVETAVMTFPTVVACDVVVADNVPGRLLNRAYPRQWAIRMTRTGVAGLGVERCTSPLYIDWDPGACPVTAADLFLNHYTWYWPSGLPKPADLGNPPRWSACTERAMPRYLRASQSSLCVLRLSRVSMSCDRFTGMRLPLISRF